MTENQAQNLPIASTRVKMQPPIPLPKGIYYHTGNGGEPEYIFPGTPEDYRIGILNAAGVPAYPQHDRSRDAITEHLPPVFRDDNEDAEYRKDGEEPEPEPEPMLHESQVEERGGKNEYFEYRVQVPESTYMTKYAGSTPKPDFVRPSERHHGPHRRPNDQSPKVEVSYIVCSQDTPKRLPVSVASTWDIEPEAGRQDFMTEPGTERHPLHNTHINKQRYTTDPVVEWNPPGDDYHRQPEPSHGRQYEARFHLPNRRVIEGQHEQLPTQSDPIPGPSNLDPRAVDAVTSHLDSLHLHATTAPPQQPAHPTQPTLPPQFLRSSTADQSEYDNLVAELRKAIEAVNSAVLGAQDIPSFHTPEMHKWLKNAFTEAVHEEDMRKKIDMYREIAFVIALAGDEENERKERSGAAFGHVAEVRQHTVHPTQIGPEEKEQERNIVRRARRARRAAEDALARLKQVPNVPSLYTRSIESALDPSRDGNYAPEELIEIYRNVEGWAAYMIETFSAETEGDEHENAEESPSVNENLRSAANIIAPAAAHNQPEYFNNLTEAGPSYIPPVDTGPSPLPARIPPAQPKQQIIRKSKVARDLEQARDSSMIAMHDADHFTNASEKWAADLDAMWAKAWAANDAEESTALFWSVVGKVNRQKRRERRENKKLYTAKPAWR